MQIRALIAACALALAAFFAGAPAFADDAERLGLARRIIATRSDEVEQGYFDALLPYYMQTLAETLRLSDGERARLPGMLREEYMTALVAAHEHTAGTYARIFSESELREILAFYESDAGRRFLANQAELSRDGIALQQVMNAAVLRSVVERLAAARDGQHF